MAYALPAGQKSGAIFKAGGEIICATLYAESPTKSVPSYILDLSPPEPPATHQTHAFYKCAMLITMHNMSNFLCQGGCRPPEPPAPDQPQLRPRLFAKCRKTNSLVLKQISPSNSACKQTHMCKISALNSSSVLIYTDID